MLTVAYSDGDQNSASEKKEVLTFDDGEKVPASFRCRPLLARCLESARRTGFVCCHQQVPSAQPVLTIVDRNCSGTDSVNSSG